MQILITTKVTVFNYKIDSIAFYKFHSANNKFLLIFILYKLWCGPIKCRDRVGLKPMAFSNMTSTLIYDKLLYQINHEITRQLSKSLFIWDPSLIFTQEWNENCLCLNKSQVFK